MDSPFIEYREGTEIFVTTTHKISLSNAAKYGWECVGVTILVIFCLCFSIWWYV